MLRKTLATLGMSAAIFVPLAALSTPAAYADNCVGADGNNLCTSGSPGVAPGDSTTIESPREVCYYLDCIERGETIATVPAGVPTVTVPRVYGTGVLADPLEDPTDPCGNDGCAPPPIETDGIFRVVACTTPVVSLGYIEVHPENVGGVRPCLIAAIRP